MSHKETTCIAQYKESNSSILGILRHQAFLLLKLFDCENKQNTDKTIVIVSLTLVKNKAVTRRSLELKRLQKIGYVSVLPSYTQSRNSDTQSAILHAWAPAEGVGIAGKMPSLQRFENCDVVCWFIKLPSKVLHKMYIDFYVNFMLYARLLTVTLYRKYPNILPECLVLG